MKKFIIFLILAMFFEISCHTSKKTENDTDILPDEDVTDADDNQEDEEETDNDEDELEDTDPCNPNPCENFANTDGTCTGKEDDSFECGCVEGYFWANPGCKKITLANICTGQKQCYNNDAKTDCYNKDNDFYGQDAHYAALGACIPQNFSSTIYPHDENIFYDKNLKLVWMQKPANSTYSWDEALKYCDNLKYADFNDWRLPSPKELMFPPIMLLPQVYYLWSSQAKNNYFAWKGQVGSHYLITTQKTETNNVRCVHGERTESPVIFEVLGNDLVSDPFNGFLWATLYTGAKTWKDALAYCENLTHAGFSDWKLPNINELLSLVDFEKENPSSDFPYSEYDFGSDMWWSSTTLDVIGEHNSYALTANISMAATSSISKYDKARVICVRSEPCKTNYFWDGVKCVGSPCSGDPCKEDEHSDGVCHFENTDYSCGCVENYFWDGKKCVNPCNSDPCKNVAHSNQKCAPVDKSHYICGCEQNYYWWGEKNECTAKEPSSANICTGQKRCYDNGNEILCHAENEDFFGQDAYYADMGFCAPHNFSIDDSVENEKTVIDNNTGLEWQQTFSEAITDCLYAYPCDEAVDYCENLNYGGHDDWRLPTILELHTIVDSEKVNPAINTDYFPNTPPEYFITSSSSITLQAAGGPHNSYQDGTREHWSVDFSTGISKMHIKSYVRCVRGEKLPNKGFDVFVGSNKKNAEIAFYSNGTLIWQAGTKSYGWQNALKYCENLNLAGLVNWRLPNKNELLEYFTPCNSYSASYYAAYWITYNSSSYHWSSTTVYDKPENAWIVDYGNCLGYAHYDSFQDKTDSYLIHTRCVTDNPCSKGEIWNGETCVKENPCEPNPCDQSYSTKTCIISTKESTGYFCECSENAFWSSDEKRCFRTCGGTNPCIYYSNSDQQCYEDEKGEFYCGCKEGYLWDSSERKCLKNTAYNDNDNDNEMSDADSDSSETPDIDTDDITDSDTDILETPDETNDTDGL